MTMEVVTILLLVLGTVLNLAADIGNLTAISLSMDISARNRPDNIAVVHPRK
jgi:hypothetical protein